MKRPRGSSMYNEARIHSSASGNAPRCENSDNEASVASIEPLGRIITVSGTQVVARFAADVALTVGSLVGLPNGDAFAVGTLCDISVENLANGERGTEAIGRVDLLGEIVTEKSGKQRFRSGVAV